MENNIRHYKIPFVIPNYMLSLILPKCNMVYGEVLSTVYLQIALNINHQKKSTEWKQKQCWLKIETISNNTNYNSRVILNTLKTLQMLKLIDIQQQKNKVYKFCLLNNKLCTSDEVKNFNNFIETQLLKGKSKTQISKLTGLFKELEKVTNYQNFLLNKTISKHVCFKDVNLLRKWLNQSSNVYKGSALFFITNIASQVFNNQEILLELSQKERAIKIGSTQSTISRYIQAYIKSNHLVVKEGNINKPIQLGLNLNFINQNLDKKVVTNMEENNVIICPICNKDFYENRSLNVHVSKIKDAKHILLNHLKKQQGESVDVNKIYLKYKEDFDELDSIEMEKEEIKIVKPPKTSEYLKIQCDCKMTCKECYKNWKSDFYNDCTHERKEAFIKEMGIEEEDKKMIKTASKNNTIQLAKEDFDVIKPTKKSKSLSSSGDSAPSLLKYFYSMTEGQSPNFGKECGQIKNLLKKGTTPEQIRITMEYLKRRGNTDLRFLNSSLNDALAEKKYMNELEVEGTEAYLVNMYYTGLNQSINIQTLVRDVQKIKETINSGLTYEQTQQVIQYMIDIKCPTINFIGSKRTEALAKANKINKIQNNPSYFDRDNLVIIRDQLMNAKINFKKIDDKFRNEALSIAIELFKQSQFMDKFSHFEWAWRIGLDLDYEMYQIAKATQTKALTLDVILQDARLTEEQRQTVFKAKNSYKTWLDNQLMKFESAQSN